MRAIWLAVAVAGAGLVTACKDSKPGTGPGNEAPVAGFAYGCVDLQCNLTDASTDDAGIASWSWGFGDDNAASVQSPVHTYTAVGPHSVSLTVTDAEGETSTVSKQVVTSLRAVTSLTCVNPSAPGGFVGCTLRLEQEAGFKVVLTSSSCDVHGNLFRVTAPIPGTLTSDGCYEQPGKELVFSAPFPAGTEINAEVVAPQLQNAPRLLVSGNYPEWVLTFEDGVDQDFDDLVMTLTALPTGN